MLKEADLREEGHCSSNTAGDVTQALFADTTWITTSAIDGCCDNENGKGDNDPDDDTSYDDNERHGVLVFQRPDNWLQLAKIPRDHQRPASMLCPIVEAMENTAISSRLICHGDHRHTLRLCFFMDQGGGGPQLSICTITHAPTIINAAWDVQKLQLSCGDDLPPAMPGMGFFKDPFRERLSYASSSGLLISLYETHDGEWRTYSYPEKVFMQPGDQVFHTVHYDKPSLYLWRCRQDESIVTEFSGYDHFTLLDACVKGVTTTKRMNWHSLTLDQSSIPFLPILDDDRFSVGLVCKTLGDDIYLFKGETWYDTHDEPIHLCKVKSGTNISLSQDLRDLLFISTENDLSRIRIQSHTSSFNYARPSASSSSLGL
ncbi:hypothetical protein LCI18_006718 [Fusarium solani-melongenae]|uniref:Uncharacterized protein n=1 Tax=Fusarium solani subsp. cucurbitae TaxID=2747967 RepID=A0ACD3Z3D4_FUSSC|nr:hypothetical protein LCI18_006718 [Fusarium solani-melongenae]